MNRAFDLGSVKSLLVAPGIRGGGSDRGPLGSIRVCWRSARDPTRAHWGFIKVHWVHGLNFGVNQGFIGGLFIRIILGVYK